MQGCRGGGGGDGGGEAPTDDRTDEPWAVGGCRAGLGGDGGGARVGGGGRGGGSCGARILVSPLMAPQGRTAH